jgi:uncharacterized protein YjbI with pentapeptide repeats
MTSTAKEPVNKNFRGMSFKGQDLSGADFSGADLRGTDFTDAILKGANFSEAETGTLRHFIVFQLILSFIMAAVSGFLSAFSGVWVAALFHPSFTKQFTIAPGLVAVIFLAVMLLTIAKQGFTDDAFKTVALTGAGTLAITVAVAVAVSLAGAGAVSVAVPGSGIVAVASAVAVAGAISVAGFAAGIWSGILIANVAVSVAIIGAIVGSVSVSVSETMAVALLVSIVTLLLSIYVALCILRCDSKFSLLASFAVKFASIGGTSFRGADLCLANFTKALLKASDFSNSSQEITNFTCSIWQQAKKLDRANLGESILANCEVRELLVTGKLNPSKSYEGLNLRGANLDGVYLKNASFKRAILSEASLRNANLEWANLTETQTIGTDFTGAQMTGVCLEGWSYDHTTKLDEVDCRFVFELEHPNPRGSRERRPHYDQKDFEKGDFTRRYSETLNVVQLLIRNGINGEAFIAALEKLTEEYPDLNPDDIQEIKKKGPDVELTVAVSEDTDKGKFEHNFDSVYESRLKDLEAKHQAQRLEDKDHTIDTIKDMFFALVEAKKGDVTVVTTTEAKTMTQQNPTTVTTGNITNNHSVFNLLSEIKGNVTNAINQLPDKKESDKQPDLKTLLTQLQEAISADKDLADENKADALEQVENLAKIALHDKPEEKSTLASKAIRALKRIIDTIPTIAKIVETVSKVFGA